MTSLDKEVAVAKDRTALQQTDAMLAELQKMPRVEIVAGVIDMLLDCRAAYSAKLSNPA
jgi:hypothetical protein